MYSKAMPVCSSLIKKKPPKTPKCEILLLKDQTIFPLLLKRASLKHIEISVFFSG